MSKIKRHYKHKKTFFNDDESERLLKLIQDQYNMQNFSALMRMFIKKEARFCGLLDYEGQRKPGT